MYLPWYSFEDDGGAYRTHRRVDAAASTSRCRPTATAVTPVPAHNRGRVLAATTFALVLGCRERGVIQFTVTRLQFS